jgi:hypothetical protein
MDAHAPPASHAYEMRQDAQQAIAIRALAWPWRLLPPASRVTEYAAA